MDRLPQEPAPSHTAPEIPRAWQDRLFALALFLGVFTIYGATLCRTIYTGDDGDFITAMATFGVPHPTGYPLFCLIGRLFIEVLPVGSPALRVNIMTALFGAAVVAMTFRFAALLAPQRFWAATAALLFAFSPTLWQQSLSCEVYSLTCLFLSVLLYLVTLWRAQPGNTRLLQALAFTYGLALTNHLTVALFLPGFLILVLATRRTLWREGKVLASLVFLFVLPLGLYAYLPLAARGDTPVAWGDPSTPAGFWAHITGAQYRDVMFTSAQLMGKHVQDYGGYLVGQYGWWFLWLVPVGALVLWRRDRALCLLLLYIWLANVAYATNYNIFDIYVYYLPSYLVTAGLIGVGASFVMGWVYDRLRLAPEVRAHYTPLVAAVALTVPIVQMSLHYAQTDKSGNFIEKDYAGNILRSAPPHAFLITGGNTTLTLWYHRFVLGQRPDVTIVNWEMVRGALEFDGWYFKHLRRLYPGLAQAQAQNVVTQEKAVTDQLLLWLMKHAVANGAPVIQIPDIRIDNMPIIGLSGRRYRSLNQNIAPVFKRVPWGIGQRLYLKNQPPPPPATLLGENETMWASFVTRGLYTGWAQADPQQEYIIVRYADAGVALGALAEKAGRYEVAKAAYERALRLYRIPAADAGLARCVKALAAGRQAVR